MATAIGAYATTAAVKSRLSPDFSTADDTLLGAICDQVNQYIESPQGTGRVLAPVASAAHLFDGTGTPRLYVKNGVRAVSLLEVADYTGQAYEAIPAGDIFLRPVAQERDPGWPAMWIVLSDQPTGGHHVFPKGYDTVRATMTTGWAAIPDDITDFALTVAVRLWHRRQSGYADIAGSSETGESVISNVLEPRERTILSAYRVRRIG